MSTEVEYITWILQETVDAQNTDGDDSHQNEIYISIPDDKWDDFANDFSVQVYNNKADYKKKSLFFSIFLAILGGVATYYFSGRSLKPLKEFSEKNRRSGSQKPVRFQNRRK